MAGAIYAGALYWRARKNKGVPVNLIRILTVVRFLAVAIICFFLLSPLIKNVFRKVEKPIIVIARDNSMSIPINNDSNYYFNIFPKQMDEFASSLGSDYEVVEYNFGMDLKSKDPLN